MPIFQVIRCFDEKCGTFQVQQAKKDKKWKCNMCGEKQSLKRIYFESTDARECRVIVQDFNMKRATGGGEPKPLNFQRPALTTFQAEDLPIESFFEDGPRRQPESKPSTKQKWDIYLENEEPEEKEEGSKNGKWQDEWDDRYITTIEPEKGRNRGKKMWKDTNVDNQGAKYTKGSLKRKAGGYNQDEEGEGYQLPRAKFQKKGSAAAADGGGGDEVVNVNRIKQPEMGTAKIPSQKTPGKWDAYIDNEESNEIDEDDGEDPFGFAAHQVVSLISKSPNRWDAYIDNEESNEIDEIIEEQTDFIEQSSKRGAYVDNQNRKPAMKNSINESTFQKHAAPNNPTFSLSKNAYSGKKADTLDEKSSSRLKPLNNSITKNVNMKNDHQQTQSPVNPKQPEKSVAEDYEGLEIDEKYEIN